MPKLTGAALVAARNRASLARAALAEKRATTTTTTTPPLALRLGKRGRPASLPPVSDLPDAYLIACVGEATTRAQRIEDEATRRAASLRKALAPPTPAVPNGIIAPAFTQDAGAVPPSA